MPEAKRREVVELAITHCAAIGASSPAGLGRKRVGRGGAGWVGMGRGGGGVKGG